MHVWLGVRTCTCTFSFCEDLVCTVAMATGEGGAVETGVPQEEATGTLRAGQTSGSREEENPARIKDFKTWKTQGDTHPQRKIKEEAAQCLTTAKEAED